MFARSPQPFTNRLVLMACDLLSGSQASSAHNHQQSLSHFCGWGMQVIHRCPLGFAKKAATSTTLVASSSIVTAIANDVRLFTGRMRTSWKRWFCRHCLPSFPRFYHPYQGSLPNFVKVSELLLLLFLQR